MISKRVFIGETTQADSKIDMEEQGLLVDDP